MVKRNMARVHCRVDGIGMTTCVERLRTDKSEDRSLTHQSVTTADKRPGDGYAYKYEIPLYYHL